MKKTKLILASALISLSLTSCVIKKKDNSTPTDNTSDSQVSKTKWNELFNLSYIAFNSNYRISIDVPANNWQATLNIDNGSFYQTNVGLASMPEGSDPVDQKNYCYYRMLAVKEGILYFDYYKYWNEWTVEEENYEIDTFFLNFGIFSFDYSKFTYNEKAGEYYSHNAFDGMGDNYNFKDMEVIIQFSSNRIKKITYNKAGTDYSMYYTYDRYGEVSVTLPEPGSVE